MGTATGRLAGALAALVGAALVACGGGTDGTDTAPDVPAEVADPGDPGMPTDLPVDGSPPSDPGTDEAADAETQGPADTPADAPEDAPAEAPDVPPVIVPVPIFDRVRISSWAEDAHFQRADAEIDAGPGPFASVRLVADLETTCYPFESWAGNPPPEGQNWPADCDAFDRNYEFTLDEPAREDDPPAIELVRAITPFGGPMRLDVDVTDVFNARPGTHRVRVTIPTWSDGAGQVSGSHGGWWVTARLETIAGTAPRRALAAIPLFNGGVGEGPMPAAAPFTLPEGTTAARIEYRATGHGGADFTGDFLCAGPAEEFCWRNHSIVLDGETAVTWTDVRTPDCADRCTLAHQGPQGGGFDYCVQNPCGAIGSVVAGRANWCPGSVTPPKVLELADLSPGPRTFAFDIPGIRPGGSWRISAVLIATAE